MGMFAWVKLKYRGTHCQMGLFVCTKLKTYVDKKIHIHIYLISALPSSSSKILSYLCWGQLINFTLLSDISWDKSSYRLHSFKFIIIISIHILFYPPFSLVAQQFAKKLFFFNDIVACQPLMCLNHFERVSLKFSLVNVTSICSQKDSFIILSSQFFYTSIWTFSFIILSHKCSLNLPINKYQCFQNRNLS